jgi:hypothetical protein
MKNAHERGSPIIVATLIAMLILFTAVIATPASPNDDSTNLAANNPAVDLTNIDITIATMATPTANDFDGQASTDATLLNDDMTLTASTASPPAVISNEYSNCNFDIGTATANPELTNLGYDGDRLLDEYATGYCDDGVYRLLTRIDGTPTRTHGSVLTT